MTRAIAYVRVSTAQQADEGVSLEAQQRKLEAYAVAMDLELVATVVDAGVSAKTLQRPGLQQCLEALEAGEADALLVVKLDRLTRSVRDLGWLLEPERFGQRWSLLSVADSLDTRSAAGRLVVNIMGAVHQWEREAIGERTREALAHLRDEGVHLGGVPLGSRATRDEQGRRVLEVDPREREVVRFIVDEHRSGRSMRVIAVKLNLAAETDPAYRTKRGGAWHASTVRNVLRRVGA